MYSNVLKAIPGGMQAAIIKNPSHTTGEVQQLIKKAKLEAQENERTRLGHELHDNVNQLLATSKLFLDMIEPANPYSHELRNMVKEYIESAYNELRNLSKGLVKSGFEQTSLLDHCKRMVNDISFSNAFVVNFDYNEEVEQLNDNSKTALLRILQEQLKNTIRYSKAATISVGLLVIDHEVILTISDDGVGFDMENTKQGIGLGNICDRAELCNGTAVITSAPGKGCSLKVTIPVE
jgi:signal transduction histidine kinase